MRPIHFSVIFNLVTPDWGLRYHQCEALGRRQTVLSWGFPVSMEQRLLNLTFVTGVAFLWKWQTKCERTLLILLCTEAVCSWRWGIFMESYTVIEDCVSIQILPWRYTSITLSLSFVALWMTAHFFPLCECAYSILNHLPFHPFSILLSFSCFVRTLASANGPEASPSMEGVSEWTWDAKKECVCVVCFVCVDVEAPFGASAFYVWAIESVLLLLSGFLLQGQWSPHPLHLSVTAGVAVSDNRVSAAAAADQASLPGLCRATHTYWHKLASMCTLTRAGQRCSLVRMPIQMHVHTHHATMPPALRKVYWWALELTCG